MEKVADPRCELVLALLESKMSPDGGFQAELRYYDTKGKVNLSLSDWGGVNKQKMNA